MEKKLKRDCSFASRLRMIFPTDSNLNTLEKSINIVKDYVVLSAGVDSLFFFCLRFSFWLLPHNTFLMVVMATKLRKKWAIMQTRY